MKLFENMKLRNPDAMEVLFILEDLVGNLSNKDLLCLCLVIKKL